MDAGALMRLDRPLDGFLCDMARRNYSERSRDDYFRNLCRLFEELPTDPTVADLTPDVLRDCLDKWADTGASTR